MKVAIPRLSWQSVDQASFGLIYGSIMVLSVLLALDPDSSAPFRPAIVLFGSVLAMTLARSLAELLAHGVVTGERIMKVNAMRSAWAGSQSILTVANVPTVFLIAAGCGWMGVEIAFTLLQIYCIVVLAGLGARAGWVISGGLWHPLLGAVSAGGLGSLLAVMKYAMS